MRGIVHPSWQQTRSFQTENQQEKALFLREAPTGAINLDDGTDDAISSLETRL
jgi:hypothetical protein